MKFPLATVSLNDQVGISIVDNKQELPVLKLPFTITVSFTPFQTITRILF